MSSEDTGHVTFSNHAGLQEQFPMEIKVEPNESEDNKQIQQVSQTLSSKFHHQRATTGKAAKF